MYLWKVDKLVGDFKSGRVNQKEEFKYMLTFSVLLVFITDPILYIDYSYNINDIANTVLSLAISVWGVYYCYKINSAGDNKDFIVRVMCIGLLVGIRLLVTFFSIFLLLCVFMANVVYEASAYRAVVIGILSVLYYIYLSKKIKAVSS
jgi:hypothetical protein